MKYDDTLNPFYVLKVAHTASDAEVRKAYLDAIRHFPPDRHPERFSEIQKSYEQIKTQRKRLSRFLLFIPQSEKLADNAPDVANRRNILKYEDWMKIIRAKRGR